MDTATQQLVTSTPVLLGVGDPTPAAWCAANENALPGMAPRSTAQGDAGRGRGLHVEVHTTTGRPDRLVAGIARTISGQVIA
ncbi:MAG TPA: hypothetical protein VM324_11790 [Egibacteraceae bacterium]|jgi:hypothetical protein|nr:hypothetical protein [Egibacteraceae bacterium]